MHKLCFGFHTVIIQPFLNYCGKAGDKKCLAVFIFQGTDYVGTLGKLFLQFGKECVVQNLWTALTVQIDTVKVLTFFQKSEEAQIAFPKGIFAAGNSKQGNKILMHILFHTLHQLIHIFMMQIKSSPVNSCQTADFRDGYFRQFFFFL